MMLHKLHLLFVFTLFFSATVFAQSPVKMGHMNLGNLLESLTETKQANIALEAYTARYVAKGDSLGKVFELAASEFSKAYQGGTLTEVQAREQYTTLQKQQQDLQAFEDQAQQEIEKKRGEMLQPILDKVNTAIKAVAKENGYLMIFDTSTGAALYAQESEDVSALVLKKLQ